MPSEKPGQEPAFPVVENERWGVEPWNGISRRDYFAAAALTGLLANGEYGKRNEEDLAGYAVNQADELIAELDKQE